MSQPKLSVETQTSIYNCLCMPLLDCFRSTKHGMYKKPCPTTPAMLLCEFHHPPISLYIIKNTNFSFKPTLSNNHVQSILFSEARLETLFFLPNLLSPLDPNNPSLSTASCSQSYPYEIHSLPLTLTSSQTE